MPVGKSQNDHQLLSWYKANWSQDKWEMTTAWFFSFDEVCQMNLKLQPYLNSHKLDLFQFGEHNAYLIILIHPHQNLALDNTGKCPNKLQMVKIKLLPSN